MKNLFIYITFSIWFLNFAATSKNTLKDLKKNKVTKEWIKNNILKIFHFDNLILFAIFIYFNGNYHDSSQLWLVRILLFGVINLYLYLNSFYDKHRIKDKIKTDDISSLLLILLFTLIPIIFYISTRKYLTTYYIMFAYIFFNYIVVEICLLLNNFIIKTVIKHEKK